MEQVIAWVWLLTAALSIDGGGFTEAYPQEIYLSEYACLDRITLNSQRDWEKFGLINEYRCYSLPLFGYEGD